MNQPQVGYWGALAHNGAILCVQVQELHGSCLLVQFSNVCFSAFLIARNWAMQNTPDDMPTTL